MSKTVAVVMTVSSLSLLVLSLLAILMSSFLIKENKKETEVFCPSLESENAASNVVVKVEQGLLKGRLVESAAGGSYASFQGIPYARSPVGDLRFKDAEPPAKWEGIRLALEEGSVCPQIENDVVVGNEDCLFLNVYSPSLTTNKLLPVMVWIHGGGFSSGSGNSDTYGPDYLVADGVIVVTLNYRLGPLGFFYWNETAPGNAGLKDQVAALKWVQNNIVAFRGDPSWVTIFGQSGGSCSVHYHTMSPLTKGLFQGAISQSGIVLDKPFVQHDPLEVSSILAKQVGCLSEDNSVTVECMRGINPRTLLKAAQRTSRLCKGKHRKFGGVFAPTVDFVTPGVEQYMSSSPLKMVMDGIQRDIPFFSGFVSHEGLLIFEGAKVIDEKMMNEFDNSLKEIVIPELCFPLRESKTEEAMKEIRKFYLNGQRITNKTLPGFVDLISDIHTQCMNFLLERNLASRRIEPMYQYVFTVYDELNLKKEYPKSLQVAGHGDDLRYLFRIEGLPEVSPNSSAALARRRMVRLWTNFAKYGKPTLHRDNILEAAWHPYTAKNRAYFEIGSVLREGTNPFAKRTEFWIHFFQKYGTNLVNEPLAILHPEVIKLRS